MIMDIFDKLPQEDVELIRSYINCYGGNDDRDGSFMAPEGMPYFLRFWSVNKAPFYKMFGDQLILKREVCFEKDPDIMEEEMDNAIRYGDSIVWGFKQYYESKIDALLLDMPYDERYELKRFTHDVVMLVRNEYDNEPLCIPAKFTTDKHPLQINKGAKAVKMLGKICKALGIEYIQYKCPHCGHYESKPFGPNECPYCESNQDASVKTDGYETFRRAHSLVLNQKKLKGNLCLSIHPLDYITMSDNECGWQSCMQWMEEAGDYRMGTIEMMNSPYCVVAYVEAKDPMFICGDGKTWNNKRWRQLLMIVPEMILGNKQYPYFSDELQGTAMKWLRELANDGDFRCVENNKRFGPYETEALQIRNQRWNPVGTESFYVHFWFNYMYNDIYDYRLAFIARGLTRDRIEYNLSGPAICTQCGEVIPKNADDEIEPSWTTCRECNGMWKCHCCGDWHYGEAYYPEDSDYPYCLYCYEHETERCEVCGDRVTRTDGVFLQLLPGVEDEELETYNWNFTIDVCSCCHGSEDFKALFGDIHIRKDMYGREREVVFVDNISDEGIECGDLSTDMRGMIRLVRKAASLEERANLVRKYLY